MNLKVDVSHFSSFISCHFSFILI